MDRHSGHRPAEHGRRAGLGRPLRTVALKLFAADRVTPDNVRVVFADAVTLIGLRDDAPDPEVGRRMIQVYDVGWLGGPHPLAFMSISSAG